MSETHPRGPVPLRADAPVALEAGDARRAARLQRLVAALSRAATPEEVSAAALRESAGALGASSGFVALLDEAGQELRVLHTLGIPAGMLDGMAAIPAGADVPATRAVRTGRTVVVGSREEAVRRFPHLLPIRDALGTRVSLAIPLPGPAGPTGVLALSFSEPRPIAREERELVETLAEQCGQAIERARLFAAERMLRERAERVQAVTTALSAAETRAEVARVLVRAQREGMGAAAGSLWLAEEGEESLRLHGEEGYDGEVVSAWPAVRRDDATPVGEAARTREPVFLETAQDWERYPEVMPELRRSGWGAAAVLPLCSGERLLGVLGCTWSGPRRFTPADRDFMLTLAGVCAQALERATLHSELVRSRDQAERASAAKTQFLAVMSHELRTPLNAILGYGELLEGGVSGPVTDAQRQQLGRIRAAGEQLLELIDQILSLSRIEAGREELYVEAVDLRELAADTVGLLEPAAARKGLALEVRRPRSAVRVSTDLGKLRQILLNLLSNALKFTDQGAVEVRVSRTRAGARVEVADTGAGIAEGERERVFEPFVQADGSPTRRHGGTGLGLAVARQLARLLGGDLTLRSRVGVGSTFVLTLPARAPGSGNPGGEAPAR